MSKKRGALPDHEIRELIEAECIRGVPFDAENNEYPNIKPSSLDLDLDPDELYMIRGDFLPLGKEAVRDVLPQMDAVKHSYDSPLARGASYIARIKPQIHMPRSIYGYSNPKSTTGRHNVLVRLICGGVSRFDTIPSDFAGEVWMLIQPGSYPIKLQPNITLMQLRFCNEDTRLDEHELEVLYKKYRLLSDQGGFPLRYSDLKISDHDGSLILTLDLSGPVAGYECLGETKVVDFTKLAHYSPYPWFRKLEVGNDGQVLLRAGGFYIFVTREKVRVPPQLACEMKQLDSRTGFFISHQAGFIDPGWGWGPTGEGTGDPLVLEVTPIKELVWRQGQPVCKIQYERMTTVPTKPYALSNPNYKGQRGPKLGKQFCPPVELLGPQPEIVKAG